MMKIKRILLTGDDGYNSIGIRTLIHFLKDRYELAIAATRDQQSGVGGHVSVATGGKWGEDKVDGINAFWVDGFPCDAVESAIEYFHKPFDLIISGINFGANIGSALVSSGTFSAAYLGLGLLLAPRAIVMSWESPMSVWYKKHNHDDDISDFLLYPGKEAEGLFDRAIEHDMWQASIININFPKAPSKKAMFTTPLLNTMDYYTPARLNRTDNTFYYPHEGANGSRIGPRTDVGALLKGKISITLCKNNLLDEKVYKKLEKEEITL